MDYPFERRRKRNYRSSSSLNISSSRDDDEIEQEIIDRAMEIERSREKSLRRQFEYIVYNVKVRFELFVEYFVHLFCFRKGIGETSSTTTTTTTYQTVFASSSIEIE